jgi:hypothetical protein
MGETPIQAMFFCWIAKLEKRIPQASKAVGGGLGEECTTGTRFRDHVDDAVWSVFRWTC